MDTFYVGKKLPTLENYEIVGYDLETLDPNLKTLGPGWPRKDGKVVGIAIGTPDNKKFYYPLCPESPGYEKFPTAHETITHFQKIFTRPDLAIVGANVGYDLGWSRTLGIEFAGTVYCVQAAEALLNENKTTYRLESLAQEYLGEGKGSDELKEEAARRGSIDKKTGEGDPWPILDTLPVELVGKYAAKDAWLTLKIHELQISQFTGKFGECYALERDILRVILDMTARGIRVDEERILTNLDFLNKKLEQELFQLRALVGRDIDIWSAEDIYEVAKEHNLPVGTPTRKRDSEVKNGKDFGFDASFLKANPNPIFNTLLAARKFDRAGNIYLAEKTYNVAINAGNGLRVYPTWRATRYESKGTKSGRFSSESPCLQQLPSRNGELAPLIRECYLPEVGELWFSADYKSQEPRLTTHYGTLIGDDSAEQVAERYNKNPNLDYHQLTADLIQATCNRETEKADAKKINLAIAYGAGKKKIAEELGMEQSEAYTLIDAYHQSLPYISKLQKMAQKKAETAGFITTLLGRKRHFNQYGLSYWEMEKEKKRMAEAGEAIPKGYFAPKFYDEAVEKWGKNRIQQWGTYKTLNALIQGSAADQTKKAMVDCWKAGIKILGTIHDELCFSVQDEDEARLAIHLMENAVELSVPMVVDAELGPRWGELKEFQ